MLKDTRKVLLLWTRINGVTRILHAG